MAFFSKAQHLFEDIAKAGLHYDLVSQIRFVLLAFLHIDMCSLRIYTLGTHQ